MTASPTARIRLPGLRPRQADRHSLFVSFSTSDAAAHATFVRSVRARYGDRWELATVEIDGEWNEEARLRCERTIKSCDALICLIGTETAASAPVDWELRTAVAFGKPVLAVRANADRSVRVPQALIGLGIQPLPCELEEAAATLDQLLVEVALFRGRSDLGGTGSATRALAQYWIIIRSAESLTDRRQSLHAFYMSINSLFLGAIGLVYRDALKDAKVAAAGIALAFVGLALCHSWLRQIRSYGLVNRSKFDVINRIESRLPIAPFVAEWMALSQTGFESFTQAERRVPKIFTVLYGAALVAGCLIAGNVI